VADFEAVMPEPDGKAAQRTCSTTRLAVEQVLWFFGLKPDLKPCKTAFSAEVGQAVLVSRKLKVSKQL
jgi:hypothetical protein